MKSLLTKNNSNWGVKVHPQSPDSYENILSFDDELTKEKFIAKYLFGDVTYDWKKELDEIEETFAFERQTDQQGILTVDVKLYEERGESVISILNKDFAITKNDDDVIEYWVLSEGVYDGSGNISFKITLDIFFNYDIKDIFNDYPTRIRRAHFDRVNKDKEIVYDYKTPFYTPEDFDETIGDNMLIPRDRPRDLIIDYESPSGTTRDGIVLEDITNEDLSKITFLIAYKNVSTLNQKLTMGKELYRDNTKISLPYVVNIYPFTNNDWKLFNSIGIVSGVPYNHELITAEEFLVDNDAIEDPNLMTNSLQIVVGLPAVENATGLNLKIKGDSANKKVTFDWGIWTSGEAGIKSGLAIEQNEFFDNDKRQLIYSPLADNVGYSNFRGDITLNNPNLTFDDNIESPKNLLMETKLYNSVYFPTKILTPTDETYIFRQELAEGLTLSVQRILGMTPDVFSMSLIPTPDTPNNSKYNDWDAMNNYNFTFYANYQLPTRTDAYKEYLIRNKATQNAGFTNSVGGMLTSMLKGSVSSILAPGINPVVGAAMGAGFGVVSGLFKLNEQFAKIKDLKTTPDTVNNSGSTLIDILEFKRISFKIQDYMLNEYIFETIANFFYCKGVNYLDNYYNINDILKSRYYFNYIEAIGTFETIKLNLSSSIKQKIDDTLSMGVTIWNVRDINTFKGVKNFNVNNVEMILMEGRQNGRTDKI